MSKFGGLSKRIVGLAKLIIGMEEGFSKDPESSWFLRGQVVSRSLSGAGLGTPSGVVSRGGAILGGTRLELALAVVACAELGDDLELLFHRRGNGDCSDIFWS